MPKKVLLILALTAALLIILFSQFRSLLSFVLGPSDESTVAVIDTKEIVAFQTEKLRAETDAAEAGTEPPRANFVVVDVRTPEEAGVSVIPGAVTKDRFERDVQEYKDVLVIPYCTVGVRSEAYAQQLIEKGFQAKNYKGSILDWIQNGLPLETLDGEPTNRVHTYSDDYSVPNGFEQVTF